MQTKSINVDLMDGISSQPRAHIPPSYFVVKHCLKAILIVFTEQPRYITIYKSCSIHGYSEGFIINIGFRNVTFSGEFSFSFQNAFTVGWFHFHTCIILCA